MNEITDIPSKLCQCGAPSTLDNLELAHTFPMIRRPLCAECEAIEESEEIEHRKRQKERQERIERESRIQAIPTEMQRTSISHPGFNADLFAKIESWKPSSAKWLGVVGSAGLSKTRCMALLANKLIMAGHRLTWTTATDFQDRVDDMRGESGERKEARAYMADVKTTAILVLDDLGKNTWTPAFERYLFGVIDYRKTHDLPVLWTANTHPVDVLKSGALTGDRGGPLVGRLLETTNIIKA